MELVFWGCSKAGIIWEYMHREIGILTCKMNSIKAYTAQNTEVARKNSYAQWEKKRVLYHYMLIRFNANCYVCSLSVYCVLMMARWTRKSLLFSFVLVCVFFLSFTYITLNIYRFLSPFLNCVFESEFLLLLSFLLSHYLANHIESLMDFYCWSYRLKNSQFWPISKEVKCFYFFIF